MPLQKYALKESVFTADKNYHLHDVPILSFNEHSLFCESSLKNLSVNPLNIVLEVMAQYWRFFVEKPYLGVIIPFPPSSLPAAPEFAVTEIPLQFSR